MRDFTKAPLVRIACGGCWAYLNGKSRKNDSSSSDSLTTHAGGGEYSQEKVTSPTNTTSTNATSSKSEPIYEEIDEATETQLMNGLQAMRVTSSSPEKTSKLQPQVSTSEDRWARQEEELQRAKERIAELEHQMNSVSWHDFFCLENKIEFTASEFQENWTTLQLLMTLHIFKRNPAKSKHYAIWPQSVKNMKLPFQFRNKNAQVSVSNEFVDLTSVATD